MYYFRFIMMILKQTYLKWITNKNLLLEHMELCSVPCGSLDRRGVLGRMATWISMVESLCCSPETTTTVLVNLLAMLQYKIKKN